MSEPRIRLTHDDGLAHLVLDYAPVNQFSSAFLQEIFDAVSSLRADTRALVVSSAVPGIFAAGGDLPWLAAGTVEEQIPFVELCQRTYSAFEMLACPAIVAIDGHCLGGGLELSLCCDIRVVGESASLGLPEARIGLIAAGGGTQRLVRAVGQGIARDMLLTGRRITGAEAGNWGLVSRVVADGEAAARALEVGRDLADGPAEAIQATKRLAVAASDVDIREGLDRELTEWIRARRSASTQEGLDAFSQKRDPDFASARRHESQD